MPKFRKCQPEKPREGRTTKGKIEHFRAIERGAERYHGRGKVFADITVERGEKERGPYLFVIKEFPDKKEALEELQKATDLKEAGVPIPKTVRYAEEDGVHMLLYSDLTEGGKYEVWSKNDPRAELFYLNLTEADIRAAEKLVVRVAQKAANADYNIYSDAYFLRRKHGGNVEVVVGDLGWGIHKAPHGTTVGNNEVEADEFIKYVRCFLKGGPALRRAYDKHTYGRLIPLSGGVKMIAEALGKSGHSREEMTAIFEKCGIGEETEDLLTRPPKSDEQRASYLRRIKDVNPTLVARIRSGDLSIRDLEIAGTLYRYARGTHERLRLRIGEREENS